RQSRVGTTVTHHTEYDLFGRFRKLDEDAKTLIEQTWSDVEIGMPSYNSVIDSTRHNLFGVSDVAVTHNWIYGGPGNRVSERTTEVSGLGNSGDAFDIQYAYDAWGNRSSVGFPRWDACRNSGFASIVTTFDGPWATVVELLDPYGSFAGIADVTYHPSGRMHAVTYGTTGTPVVRTEVADDDGMPRPKSVSLTGGASVLGLYGSVGAYSFDGSGNLWRVGDKRFNYDGMNRLKSEYAVIASRSFGVSAEFLYDRWGNQTMYKGYNGSGGLELQLTYAMEKNAAGIPTTNRIDTVNDVQSKSLVTLGWDGRGNLATQPAVGPLRAKTFNWSEDDRLMESTDTATGATWRYAYDAGGERVLRWHDAGVGTEAVVTLRDEGGQALSEWRNVAGTQQFDVVRDSVYLGASRVAELDHTAMTDTIRFIASDHLGSPKVIFDQSGELVDWMKFRPFGELAESGNNPPATTHLFTGHERDLGTASSELDYFHQRYYSPELARFVSVDPVAGKVGSSQSWNRYSYTLNNPLKFVDPDGREVFLAIRPVNKTNSVGGHSFFVIVPTGSNQQYFSNVLRPGTNKFTIGGHKRDGRLRTLVNESSDVVSASGPMDDQNQRFLLSPPKGMSMEEFEYAVFAAMMSQDNRYSYAPINTDGQSGTANCNSLAKGTIDGVGAEQAPPREELEGWTPGWDDPVNIKIQVVQPGIVRVNGTLRFVNP
ncbi:MAG: hypothetical protein DRJ65_08330, partial [Acidobacteria bacterium]